MLYALVRKSSSVRAPICAAIAALLVSCGGGGGGGPSTAPSAEVLIPITDESALVVAAAGGTFPESMLQLAALAVTTLDTVAAADTLPAYETCANGGTVDYQLIDVDQNSAASPGDTVISSFRGCFMIEVNSTLDGDFIVNLSSAAAPVSTGVTSIANSIVTDTVSWAGTIDARAMTLHIIDDFDSAAVSLGEIVVSGDLDFRLDRDLLTEVLEATIEDELILDAVTSSGSFREIIRNSSAEKVVRYDEARYEVNVSGEIVSEAIPGRLRFSTPQPLVGNLNTLPDSGYLRVDGANGSYLKLHADAEQSALEPLFEVRPAAGGCLGQGCGNGQIGPQDTWDELMDGFFWWEPLSGDQLFYVVKPADYDKFEMVYTDYDFWDAELPVDFEMRVIFSRPLDPEQSIEVEMRTGGLSSVPVATETEVFGAMLLIRPAEQLTHGAPYLLRDTPVADQDSNIAWTPSISFNAANNLVAAPFVSPELASPGEVVQLVGSQSTATGSSIAAYQWKQLSGSPGVIVNPGLSDTTFTVPALTAPENIEFELQITNVDGQLDSEAVTLQALGPTASSVILYFESSEGDGIGDGETRLITNATGTMYVGRNMHNSIVVNFSDSAIPSNRWGLVLAAPGSVDPGVAVYENATRWPFHLPGAGLAFDFRSSGCNELSGRFEILELEYGLDSIPTKLAVNFEQSCEPGGAPLYGYLRLYSDLPIPGLDTG